MPSSSPAAMAAADRAAAALDRLTRLHPKLIDDINWESFDLIISMGCGVNCPIIRIDLDWGLEDPVGQPLDVFEECAKTIEENLKNLGY